MRAHVFLIYFFFTASSFGDSDFNSKSRQFNIDLLYHTVLNSDRDVVISPYVIWSLLIAMAYETSGVTREQVSKVLLSEDRSEVVDEFMKLRNAVLMSEGANNIVLLNFLFYDEYSEVRPDGINRLENDFRFITERLNFAQNGATAAQMSLRSFRVPVRAMIRSEDFVDSTMVMCSYLLFNATWVEPFSVSDSLSDHYRDGNEIGKVNMMYMKARLRSVDLETWHASITELPYGDGTYCMLLVRPHSGYDVIRVLRILRHVSLKNVLAMLQRDADEFGLREVEVKLPKYSINSVVNLNKPLIDAGLSGMFDRNFGNFDNFAAENLYIGDITHRVTLIITESGTKVYTTTPGYEVLRRTPAKELPVKDPLVFLIIEKSTATIVFGGTHSKVYLN